MRRLFINYNCNGVRICEPHREAMFLKARWKLSDSILPNPFCALWNGYFGGEERWDIVDDVTEFILEN